MRDLIRMMAADGKLGRGREASVRAGCRENVDLVDRSRSIDRRVHGAITQRGSNTDYIGSDSPISRSGPLYHQRIERTDGCSAGHGRLEQGHDVVIVSGPVVVDYPSGAELIPVMTTDEMLDAAVKEFARCDGAIGAAAPCDYMPRVVQSQKISKTGGPLTVELVETPDVVATLGQSKQADQWVVGFALETEDQRFRATVKLEKNTVT